MKNNPLYFCQHLLVSIACFLFYTAIQAQVNAQFMVKLEAPYNANTGNMSAGLANAGLLPTTQPYNVAPWNYMGNEAINGMDFPPNVIGWVLLELRAANDVALVVAKKAALLTPTGLLIDPLDLVALWDK